MQAKHIAQSAVHVQAGSDASIPGCTPGQLRLTSSEQFALLWWVGRSMNRGADLQSLCRRWWSLLMGAGQLSCQRPSSRDQQPPVPHAGQPGGLVAALRAVQKCDPVRTRARMLDRHLSSVYGRAAWSVARTQNSEQERQHFCAVHPTSQAECIMHKRTMCRRSAEVQPVWQAQPDSYTAQDAYTAPGSADGIHPTVQPVLPMC